MKHHHFTRFRLKWILLWLSAAMVSGCMVGPDYHKPPTEVPAKWKEDAHGVTVIQTADVSHWWTVFKDPKLDSLVERAVGSNKDLKVAEARVREARAQRQVVASQLYPTVNASAGYSTNQGSANVPGGGTTNPSYNLFQAGFDATWELDIFGKTRRSVEAANANIQVTEENRRDVLVTLLSDVAVSYLQVRGSQLRLAIANSNIVSQKQTLELTEARFAAGLSSELDVAQQKAQLAATEATVPAFETTLRVAIHQLSVLLGLSPGALEEELLQEAPLPPPPPDVPVGLPSELLRRRPDIRSAERQLAQTTAQIGVATADLFPQFSLTGSLGQQSMFTSKFFVPLSNIFSMGPSVTWPVFDAGRIRANIQVKTAVQEQALISYEQTILIAMKDVEDSLVSYSRGQSTREYLRQSVDANQRAYDISYELYMKGLVDFLNVLVSQRNLFLTQDQLAQTEQQVSTDLVSLYKALGGGWEIAPDS